jgi:hypothetical protein
VADEKVRDIIGEIVPRMVCGEDMLQRIGRRAWSRPRVAVSNRLYRLYRIPDPWDPNARKESTPIGLGPVNLRLGQDRRQPAPHLKPKPSQKEKRKQTLADRAKANPRVPPAVKHKPTPAAKASPSVQAKAEVRAAEEARSAEIAARMRAAEAARGPSRRRAPPVEASQPSRSVPPIPVRPDIGAATLARSSQDGAAPAIDPPSRPKKKSVRGRFRMQSKKVTSATVVKPVMQAVDPLTQSEGPVVPEVAVRRRTMPAAGGGSMDDMFAAAAQMGRLSMRRDETGSEGGEEE